MSSTDLNEALNVASHLVIYSIVPILLILIMIHFDTFRSLQDVIRPLYNPNIVRRISYLDRNNNELAEIKISISRKRTTVEIGPCKTEYSNAERLDLFQYVGKIINIQYPAANVVDMLISESKNQITSKPYIKQVISTNPERLISYRQIVSFFLDIDNRSQSYILTLFRVKRIMKEILSLPMLHKQDTKNIENSLSQAMQDLESVKVDEIPANDKIEPLMGVLKTLILNHISKEKSLIHDDEIRQIYTVVIPNLCDILRILQDSKDPLPEQISKVEFILEHICDSLAAYLSDTSELDDKISFLDRYIKK